MAKRAPRLLIIEARFYEVIADELARGAIAALEAAGAKFERVAVPGVLETPAALACAVEAGRHDGYVMLGCVIRGETGHYDIVAVQSARAIMDLAVKHRLALGNGILTVENRDQAWVRARVSKGDKGGMAARAALAMIEVKAKLEKAK
ncbi:MAG: 6,7-dimethyl-8-ribityllumazine synthase [Hyphomicrobiales bacterium]|nr:6,7-dimethyl-8-ribityllumazine synthase [Hyphomicrobiales bacterium]